MASGCGVLGGVGVLEGDRAREHVVLDGIAPGAEVSARVDAGLVHVPSLGHDHGLPAALGQVGLRGAEVPHGYGGGDQKHQHVVLLVPTTDNRRYLVCCQQFSLKMLD